jgi:hypothetical protein
MNENNKILERVLLMMKYDSSKTLRENSDVVKEEFSQQLNEAPPRLRARAPKPKPKVGAKTMTASGLSVSQIKAQTARYAQTPLKNGQLPTSAQVKAYANKLATGKSVTVTAPATSTITVKPPKPRGPRKPPTPKDKSILSRISNNIKNNKGKWAIGLIIGAGLTATGIYLYLQPKVSPCLLNSLTDEELASLGEAGTTGKISRKEIGNRFADKNGGLTFGLDNTTVTTGNGQYSGSYSCDGNNIKVSIAGMDFIIGGGGADKGTSGGGGGSTGGGGGKYKQCSETLPIAMNCKNSTIARVQGCIGVTQDGAFGPKTSAALVAKGADGSSITQATIDKVCGGGTAEKEKDPSSALSDDFSGQKSTGDSASTGASEPQGDTNL